MGAGSGDMQLINKFNIEFRFALCPIDIHSKYTSVVPLKDKKAITFVNAFQIILDESGRKPNKIWVDKGSRFYNKLMKSCLQDNGIEIHSIYNERKSAATKKFIRTLKNKNL